MKQKVLPVFQVIIAIALMYAIKHFLPSFGFQLAFKTELCGLLILLSVIIGFTAIYSFKKHNTTVNPTKAESTSTIVNTGLFAYSRNPMYLAMLIFLLAIGILISNWLVIFPILLFIWFITEFQIKPEEEILTKYFKDEYLTYLSKVRRWI